MIAASLLTKNLQTHWLAGAQWFWDTLVDADLANNTPYPRPIVDFRESRKRALAAYAAIRRG